MTKADHPHSMGAFKPVGHIVAAMPDDDRAAQAVRALREAGCGPHDILEYTAAEEGDEMDRMLAQTSEFAGFGYEVTLMRRFQRLAKEGASWLIVYAPGDDMVPRIADVLRRFDCLLAVKYHWLAIEELI
jgi:hypothetical protein